jgi:hypothetical protein
MRVAPFFRYLIARIVFSHERYGPERCLRCARKMLDEGRGLWYCPACVRVWLV